MGGNFLVDLKYYVNGIHILYIAHKLMKFIFFIIRHYNIESSFDYDL